MTQPLKIARAVAIALAVVYLGIVGYKTAQPDFMLSIGGLPVGWLVKSLPIILAAGLVFRQVRGKMANRVAIGLVFSSGGDIVLALAREDLFVLGLGLFLVAHVFYIAAFAHQFRLMRNKLLLAFRSMA